MTASPETSEIQPAAAPLPEQETGPGFTPAWPIPTASATPAGEFVTRMGFMERLGALKLLNEQFLTDNPQFNDLFPIIEGDGELLKRFLKFSNSGWFDSRIQIDSPYAAYTRFGIQGFYKLALASFISHGIGELGTRFKLWPHLESVARTAEKVAYHFANQFTEDIFSVAILHDSMVASMEKELPDYLYFLECAMNLDAAVTRLEDTANGFNHADAAAELAAALAFKPEIVAAIAHHHRDTLNCVPEGNARTILALFLIAKRIIHLRRTEKRNAFETASDKRLLEEMAAALKVRPGRILLGITSILDSASQSA